jgi:hypothetical protein
MTASLDALARIDPRAAAAYLRLHGWILSRTGELGDRWQHRGDDATRNLALPHPDLDEQDRTLMFSTALKVLQEVEQRPALAITRELRDADTDIVMFRLVAPELSDGNIPLVAAPEMLAGALDAIRSAGRAEVERRAAFTGGQLPSQVKTFLDGAVVTPAEKGSVILNVRSKVDATTLAQTSLLSEAQRPPTGVPFERRALWRLLAGVKAAKTAVHRDLATLSDPYALDADIEDGLTANLCDALTNLAGDASDLEARVSVAVRWSLFVPSDEPSTIVEVGRSELDALPRIAETLRAIRPLENRTLRGYVRNLDREPGHEDGTIRLLADVEGRVSVVRLHLAAADYQTAIHAHEQNVELQFSGTLEKAGKIWDVTSPTAVSIIDHPAA